MEILSIVTLLALLSTCSSSCSSAGRVQSTGSRRRQPAATRSSSATSGFSRTRSNSWSSSCLRCGSLAGRCATGSRRCSGSRSSRPRALPARLRRGAGAARAGLRDLGRHQPDRWCWAAWSARCCGCSPSAPQARPRRRSSPWRRPRRSLARSARARRPAPARAARPADPARPGPRAAARSRRRRERLHGAPGEPARARLHPTQKRVVAEQRLDPRAARAAARSIAGTAGSASPASCRPRSSSAPAPRNSMSMIPPRPAFNASFFASSTAALRDDAAAHVGEVAPRVRGRAGDRVACSLEPALRALDVARHRARAQERARAPRSRRARSGSARRPRAW